MKGVFIDFIFKKLPKMDLIYFDIYLYKFLKQKDMKSNSVDVPVNEGRIWLL